MLPAAALPAAELPAAALPAAELPAAGLPAAALTAAAALLDDVLDAALPVVELLEHAAAVRAMAPIAANVIVRLNMLGRSLRLFVVPFRLFVVLLGGFGVVERWIGELRGLMRPPRGWAAARTAPAAPAA